MNDIPLILCSSARANILTRKSFLASIRFLSFSVVEQTLPFLSSLSASLSLGRPLDRLVVSTTDSDFASSDSRLGSYFLTAAGFSLSLDCFFLGGAPSLEDLGCLLGLGSATVSANSSSYFAFCAFAVLLHACLFGFESSSPLDSPWSESLLCSTESSIYFSVFLISSFSIFKLINDVTINKTKNN